METLEEIISLLRIVIIPLGTIARVVFCFIKMIYDEDAINSYKKKIWNAVAFLIISELIFVIVDIIKFYYGAYITSSVTQPFFNGGGAGGGGGSAGGR
ncbi:MAG: mercury transporter [Bacilli bacterium]